MNQCPNCNTENGTSEVCQGCGTPISARMETGELPEAFQCNEAPAWNYPLFELLAREHGLTLMDSEMDEIINVVHEITKAGLMDQVKSLRMKLTTAIDVLVDAGLESRIPDEIIAESKIKALEKQVKEMREMLTVCTVASCTCLTKTPEVKFHGSRCRYRQIKELLAKYA